MLSDAGSVVLWRKRRRLEGRFIAFYGRSALGMGLEGGLGTWEKRYFNVVGLLLRPRVGAIDMILR